MSERGTSRPIILVIGYGNELRGDDGLGPHVAEAIAAANYPGVRVRTVCQLVPELAAELAEARMVIFVDALAEREQIGMKLMPLEDDETITNWNTHRDDPRTLLALARAIYGRTPEAWWVVVPGQHFGFGEGLSTVALTNAKNASELIQTLIADRGTDSPPAT